MTDEGTRPGAGPTDTRRAEAPDADHTTVALARIEAEVGRLSARFDTRDTARRPASRFRRALPTARRA